MAYATIHTNYGLQRLAWAETAWLDEKASNLFRYDISSISRQQKK